MAAEPRLVDAPEVALAISFERDDGVPSAYSICLTEWPLKGVGNCDVAAVLDTWFVHDALGDWRRHADRNLEPQLRATWRVKEEMAGDDVAVRFEVTWWRPGGGPCSASAVLYTYRIGAAAREVIPGEVLLSTRRGLGDVAHLLQTAAFVAPLRIKTSYQPER